MTNMNYHCTNTPYLYSLICYRPPFGIHTDLFPHDVLSTIGPGPPHYWGFTITLRHSVGPLWTSDQPDADTSTCTTNNAHKRQKSMLPAEFEPAVPPNKRPQTHSTDRKAPIASLN